ncbi:hypothetical protein CHCC16874_2511 [Bacillus licheniformis]|nr:hypothetical protein CHCC16874_2511 [Bacillus licheniformis]
MGTGQGESRVYKNEILKGGVREFEGNDTTAAVGQDSKIEKNTC